MEPLAIRALGLRDAARGVVPTAVDSWGSAPNNLANCTDGDATTVTGTGSKTASGTIGSLLFDLGSAKEVIVTAKVGMWTDTGNITPYMGYSDNGSTLVTMVIGQSTSATTEQIRYIGPMYINARYFYIRGYTSTSATGQMKFYDVKAHQLG